MRPLSERASSSSDLSHSVPNANLPRLVATDMDGTFLDDQGDYDRVRFARLLRTMREAGCRFVIASGNQYYQLRSFFEDDWELTYVAENGALTIENGEVVSCVAMEAEVLARAWQVIQDDGRAEAALCGRRCCHVQRGTASERFFRTMSRYFTRIEWVDDLTDVNDVPLKFSLSVDNGSEGEVAGELSEALGGALVPVVSGNGSIDLMVPGCTKASALRLLCRRWGLSASDCIAFGDSENDVEMLREVGWGYAMENASARTKEAANSICPSNQESGVLVTLESIFGL